MSIRIDLFNIVPGCIIEVPSSIVGETRRIIAHQVFRSHIAEQVVIVPLADEDPHIGHFTERVSLIGIDPNNGTDEEPIERVNGGELTYETRDEPATIKASNTGMAAGSLVAEAAHGLRQHADPRELDGVDDTSVAVMVELGYDSESSETSTGSLIRSALDIIGYAKPNALFAIHSGLVRARQARTR